MSLDAQQVGDFLKANPDFLKQNPGILAFVHLPSGSAGGNVASLHERQMQTMRDKVKALEHKLVELSRAAVENQSIIDSLQAVQRRLLMVQDAEQLPNLITQLIGQHFHVPMVKLVLWRDQSVDQADVDIVNSMNSLFCGFAENAPTLAVFEGESVQPRSVVLIPLRVGASPESFGCLGLGSSDKDRFAPNLETDFLATLAEMACAALSRLNKAAN